MTEKIDLDDIETESDDGTGKETRWSDWGTIAAVALFVVALVWTTVF